MAKAKKVARGAKTGKLVSGYSVLGRTSDGVRILEPKGKPKSFTVGKLRKAIAATCAEKAR